MDDRVGTAEPPRNPDGQGADREELEQFVYSVSHDLQAPLRAVVGFSELLANRLEERLDIDERRQMGMVVEAARRMQTMIQALTTYSRLCSRPGAPERVDANAVVESVVRRLAEPIEALSARVTWEGLPVVLADRRRLETLAHCLLHNALTYHGDREPVIEISAAPVTGIRGDGANEAAGRSPGWEFTVRDNGIGVDPQQTDRIFRPFQRLHTREEFPGIGMGLTIARRIVEEVGGTIRVGPAPGGGAEFRFVVPDRIASTRQAGTSAIRT